jgi:hypothetical protein
MAVAVFLFGAGASYGSDTQGVPPLGTELFDKLQEYNPDGWGAVPDDLAACFREDFEAGMRAFSASRPRDTDVLQRAMAGYFFRFQPAETNLYVDLARRILNARWDGALATLNYERLLELAFQRAGVGVNRGRLDGGGVEICFPHGCCHLFAQIRATGDIVFAPEIRFNSPDIRIIEDPSEHARELVSSVVPPVMSYFQPDKPTRAGPSFIAGQRERWRELAQAADTVAVVGVRVRPHDDHIWAPLASTSARIVYCGGPSAAAGYEAWEAQVRPKGRDRVLKGYFREEFETICHEMEL